MKLLFILFFILTTIIASGQELERYNSYAKYLMRSENPTEQAIYDNIIERAFSMGLSNDDFYREVNNQARYAMTVKILYHLDELEAKGADHGIFMMLFTSALKEGAAERIDLIRFTTTSFSIHYNWYKVLQSYTLSSGMIRGKIALKEELKLE